MNNVSPLFPNATDEQWEDHMMPELIDAMQLLWAAANRSNLDRCVVVAGDQPPVWAIR